MNQKYFGLGFEAITHHLASPQKPVQVSAKNCLHWLLLLIFISSLFFGAAREASIASPVIVRQSSFFPLPLRPVAVGVGGSFLGSAPLAARASSTKVSTRLDTVRFSDSAHSARQSFTLCSQVNITLAFRVTPISIKLQR